MQRLSSRIWPLGWHPGGLGWWLGRRDDPRAEVVVVRSGDQLLGWASTADEHDATIDSDPAHPDAGRALIDWVGAAGYTVEAPRQALFRDAQGVVPDLADGYSLRHVEPHELDERVEVHRAAWLPAALPYHPDHRPDFEPGATSNFTTTSTSESAGPGSMTGR